MKSLFQGIIVVSMAIALSACGSSTEDTEDTSCNILYNTTTIQVGDSGLVLEPSENMYVTFSQIEAIYIDVETCMGVVATGPIVVFTSFSECVEVLGLNCEGLGGNLGQYSIGAQLVLMNTDEHVFDRNCVTDRDTLKHEFVHHLLEEAMDFPIEDNVNHNSSFFGICT